jgi:hypothetical protein
MWARLRAGAMAVCVRGRLRARPFACGGLVAAGPRRVGAETAAGGPGDVLAETNCAQQVTPCAMADDNETDTGGVGTPELTPPGPFPGSDGDDIPPVCRAGSTGPEPIPVAFVL